MSRQIQRTESTDVTPSGNEGLSNLNTSSSYPITNGYHDTSNTSYARFTLSTSTAGHIYYTFNVSLPSGAVVTGVSAKAKVRVNNTTRVTNTLCQLYSGTTAKGSNATFNSTSSSNVVTLSTGTSWSASDMSNLRMLIGATGSSSTSSKYIYFYGAEVTISYTVNVTQYELTVTNSTSAVVTAEQWTDAGEDASVLIDSISNISVKDNGTDVTSQFSPHQIAGTETSDLGSYALVSGGFNGSGATYFSGIVGHGADTTTVTTTNYYSSGSGTIAVFTYDMGVTVPSNATITRVYVRVSGHAESTSNSSEYMCAQLISGSTNITDEVNFKDIGTSNSIHTLEGNIIPTVEQCASMKLQCRLGYYGGAINGATVYVEYTAGSDGYIYVITAIATDHSIVVSGTGSTPELYVKVNGSWVQVQTAYKKVNGSWVQQSDLTTVFQQGVNYKQG